MRRLLARLLRPLARVALRFVRVGDPWERLSSGVAIDLFGAGSRRDFRWYFDGESAVTVASVDALCEWLLACEYASDTHLFQESDFWQHPRTFEHLRKGDCEDHALWAWRKLTELDVDAEFYVGYWRPASGAGIAASPGYHAWVVCRIEGVEHVFEAVARDRQRMLRPLAEVRGEYVPYFCVDRRFQRHAFAGYLLSSRAPIRTDRATPRPVVRVAGPTSNGR